MLRGILVLLLAIVSLPLTVLYFLLRLTFGRPRKISANGAQARRIRSSAEARSAQIRADAIAAAHARRQAAR